MMIGYTPDILVRGRALARTRMRATVVIRRKTGEFRNPETGGVEPVWSVIYGGGPAEVRINDNDARTGDALGQRFSIVGPVVVLPADGDFSVEAAAVDFDDVGEVLTDLDSPSNVGLRFRVDGPHPKSLATARRLPVEVLSVA